MRVRLSLLLIIAVTVCAQGLSNRRAPSFSLPDSALQQHDLLDYRGTWLLLDFMETSGPNLANSKALSAKLEAAKKQYGSKLAVLSIVLTPPETQATVAKYVSETKITSPIVFDSSQVAISYFKATPQNRTFDSPHLFAINPSGLIVKDWTFSATQGPAFFVELDRLITGSPAKSK